MHWEQLGDHGFDVAVVGATGMVGQSDLVLVGRLRRDFDSQRLWLWEVSKNLRKGAATNALQIAEAPWARGLVKPRTGLT